MSFLRRDGAHKNAPRPNLVLLDLNLPIMDGREFLAHVKSDASSSSIPMIVLTASDAKEDVAVATSTTRTASRGSRLSGPRLKPS